MHDKINNDNDDKTSSGKSIEINKDITDSSSYKVTLDVFEGPMDLLLYLIKKNEVNIYDIPIEKITSQYIEYMNTFKSLSISLAGEFILMASNLCYIKSKMMLPKYIEVKYPDDEEIEDPRLDLIKQIIEYKKFKEVSEDLSLRENKQLNQFPHHSKEIVKSKKDDVTLSDEVSIFDLIHAFQNIIDRIKNDDLGEIIDDNYTVSDKIDFILNLIKPGNSIMFKSLFKNIASKEEIIVTFLALLELMKINHIKARQKTLLGEIELFRKN